MEINKESMFSNYGERMKRIALFEPLYSLSNKKQTDQNKQAIDMFEIGLITLMFFFENKLMRNKEIGINELSRFIHDVLNERYDLKQVDYIKLSRLVIENFRPASGKRLSKTYFNHETNKEEQVYFSIIKAGKSNIEENKQYYELDEDGLELIFSTREYFSEYQISISQMLLRKQLEKGEFVSALRQIDEMLLSVHTLKDRMIKLKREVKRNITSEKVFNRYEKLLQDINSRLELEHKEFEALRAFVVETIKRLKNTVQTDKDKSIYRSALTLAKALEQVHNEHNKLLNDSIEIKSIALTAAKEALYFVGVESFNFNKEVVSKIVSEAISLKHVHLLTKPFLSLEKPDLWSPLSVFFKQRIINKETDNSSGAFLDCDEKQEEEVRNIELIYEFVMKQVLEYLDGKNTLVLNEFITYIKQSEDKKVLETRYFYDFWMSLHQLSPIEVHFDEEDKTRSMMVLAIHLLRNRFKSLTVNERKQIISINERFSISDMHFTLEEKYEL